MTLWQKITRIGKMALGDEYPDSPPSFDKDYQQADSQGYFCSSWGTSKYYIDNDNNMYIGRGELKGRLYDIIGDNRTHDLRTINFIEPVKAPVDSSRLFSATKEIHTSEQNPLRAIKGLDKLDTSPVRNMRGMFANDSFLGLLDLSNWDTSHVQDMSLMFLHLFDLTDVKLSDWDTRQVINMRGMFDGTKNLKALDLHHWQTNRVKDMSWMFTDTSNLNTLDLSNFDTSQIKDTSAMFLWMNDKVIIKMNPNINQSKIPLKGSSIQTKKANKTIR